MSGAATPTGPVAPVGPVVLTSDLLEVHVLPLGARVHRVRARDRHGLWDDLVLHLADAEDYLAHHAFAGATVGRVANRIAGGDLPIDGVHHRLATQGDGATLHGGPEGFDRRPWRVAEVTAHTATLALTSPDGDQGFPGQVEVTAFFSVADATLSVEYAATTTAPTAVALSLHPYWNLGGDLRDHELVVHADGYHPVDAHGIPTGRTAPVAGTPFDLRHGPRLGDVLDALAADGVPGGLDHDLVPVPPGTPGAVREVARLRGGGRTVVVESDQPGLQVYTGGAFDGRPFPPFAGVALEPQNPPDAVHHDGWPSPVLRPGEVYRWRSSYTVA